MKTPKQTDQQREYHKEKSRRYRSEHPDRAKQAVQKWRQKHPEQVKEMDRWSNIKRSYGIGKDEFYKLLEQQHNICPICNQPLDLSVKNKKSKVSIDHCHQTGKIRGLLHNECNLMIGHAHDSPETLRRAALYVETQGITSTMDTSVRYEGTTTMVVRVNDRGDREVPAPTVSDDRAGHAQRGRLFDQGYGDPNFD